jgi:hypothetical protein
MKPTKDELAQLDLGITDLERCISETTSRVTYEPGAFGSLQVLHFMEQALEELLRRRQVLHQQLRLDFN